MEIGHYPLSAPVVLAPMAGVTDKPFREICRSFGAALAACEMVSSDQSLYMKQKTLRRTDLTGELSPVCVQIVGANPEQMAQAAILNVQNGAQIIDINMGCPAKKVCTVAAGSALLKNEQLVEAILHSVVNAVTVPVTLKTRLGWDDTHKNIETIAQIAQKTGIAALTIHGRTRAQKYEGKAEYEMIGRVKTQSTLPIIANGDIDSPQKAKAVLQQTGADAVMIGRAVCGRPWIFRDIVSFLQTGTTPEPLSVEEITQIILAHLEAIYAFYGEYSGCRIARKHISWYTKALENSNPFRQQMYLLDSTKNQFAFVHDFLMSAKQTLEAWPVVSNE